MLEDSLAPGLADDTALIAITPSMLALDTVPHFFENTPQAMDADMPDAMDADMPDAEEDMQGNVPGLMFFVKACLKGSLSFFKWLEQLHDPDAEDLDINEDYYMANHRSGEGLSTFFSRQSCEE